MKDAKAGMTLIVKTITRLTAGLILIYGIYIVFRGHISPGGGFAGGIIIVLAFIHLILAFGKEVILKKLNHRKILYFTSTGAMLFLITCVFNLIGGRFLDNPSEHFKILSGGLTPLSEISIALMVGAGLLLIFSALVLVTGAEEDK